VNNNNNSSTNSSSKSTEKAIAVDDAILQYMFWEIAADTQPTDTDPSVLEASSSSLLNNNSSSSSSLNSSLHSSFQNSYHNDVDDDIWAWELATSGRSSVARK